MTFSTKAAAREFAAKMVLTDAVVIPTTHDYWVIVKADDERREKTCSICGELFPEPDNNAQPINDGRCCAYCDDHVVTPARIEQRAKAVQQ